MVVISLAVSARLQTTLLVSTVFPHKDSSEEFLEVATIRSPYTFDIENSQKYIHGLRDEAVSGLVDLLEAGRSGSGAGLGRKALMVLFDAENPLMSRDLAVEIFTGAKGSTGNSIAQKGAQAWLDTIEGMRQRFNAAGGDIRKLDYGYLPQPHDAGRVLDAGLWRYSRHPNYFFEWLGWLAYPAIAFDPSQLWTWVTWIAPVVMFILLRFATGVPATEKSMLASRGDKFRDYQRRVSAFFPLPPKGKTS